MICKETYGIHFFLCWTSRYQYFFSFQYMFLPLMVHDRFDNTLWFFQTPFPNVATSQIPITRFNEMITPCFKLFHIFHHSRMCVHMNIHRSEEHTSELQSRFDLVCRLLLE